MPADDNMFTPDETPNSPDKEANEQALNAKLQDYYKALEEEWTSSPSNPDGDLTPTQVRDKTKQLLTQAVPKAVGSLLYLSQHAQAESVKLQAARYIVDKGLGSDPGGLVGDPLEQLLNELSKKS
jgi:hypothetical protein